MVESGAPPRLVPGAVRRAFAARPSAGEADRRLYAEAAVRLREHLEPIRIEPRWVLDVGTGPGLWVGELQRLFPRARIVTSDLVAARLRAGSSGVRRRRWPGRARPAPVAMDATAPAVRVGTMDLVTSNLMLHWVDDYPRTLRACAAVLRPGGLLLLSTLGADTLGELREAWSAVDTFAHVHPLADMHDIGDALVGAGLADVVMDAERVTLTYRSPGRLLEELRRLEGGNLAAQRPRGLTTPRRIAAMCDAYEALPGARDDGRVRTTVELVFAHAWAPARAPAAPVVEVAPPTPARR